MPIAVAFCYCYCLGYCYWPLMLPIAIPIAYVIAIAYCYCLLLMPIAIVYCYCLFPLPIAIAYFNATNLFQCNFLFHFNFFLWYNFRGCLSYCRKLTTWGSCFYTVTMRNCESCTTGCTRHWFARRTFLSWHCLFILQTIGDTMCTPKTHKRHTTFMKIDGYQGLHYHNHCGLRIRFKYVRQWWITLSSPSSRTKNSRVTWKAQSFLCSVQSTHWHHRSQYTLSPQRQYRCGEGRPQASHGLNFILIQNRFRGP